MLISWRPSLHYKVVIIGGGAIGKKIAEALEMLNERKNVQLVAVCCRTLEKATAFAKHYRCAAYDNYEQMLDSEKPDLAIICTPSGAHLEPALVAISRGVHVLIEKPMEITHDRILQIIQAAENRGVVARGIFQKRYSTVYRLLRRALQEGRFGDPKQIQMGLMVPWYRPRSYFHYPSGERNWKGTWKFDGGGATMNQGIHGIDQLYDLSVASMGDGLAVGTQSIASVHGAIAGNITPVIGNSMHEYIEGEDSMNCRFMARNGIQGSFMASTCLMPGFDQTLKVTGANGAEVILREDVPAVWRFPDKITDYDTLVASIICQSGPSTSASANPMAIGVTQHADCILDTLADIEGRGIMFNLSARNAGIPVLAVLGMYESARRNGATVLPGDLVAG